jgi:hypothetical protein
MVIKKIIADYMKGLRPRDAEVEAALRRKELSDPNYDAKLAKLEREAEERKIIRAQDARAAERLKAETEILGKMLGGFTVASIIAIAAWQEGLASVLQAVGAFAVIIGAFWLGRQIIDWRDFCRRNDSSYD